MIIIIFETDWPGHSKFCCRRGRWLRCTEMDMIRAAPCTRASVCMRFYFHSSFLRVMRPAWNANTNLNLLAAPGTVCLSVLFSSIPHNVHAVSRRTCTHLLNVSPQTHCLVQQKPRTSLRLRHDSRATKLFFMVLL